MKSMEMLTQLLGKNKKIGWSDVLLLLAKGGVVFAFIAMFYLFFEFAFHAGGPDSDFGLHALLAFDSSKKGSLSYSTMHFTVKALSQIMVLFKNRNIMYYQLGIVFVIFAAQWFSYRIIRDKLVEQYKNVTKAIFFAISILMISMIITDSNARYLYLGIGTSNPWHNPTYLFSRPFCILLFYYVLTALNSGKKDNKTYYLIGLFAFLGMAAKPSFFLSFLPAISIFVGMRFLMGKLDWRGVWKLGVALSFSLIPLLVIYILAFDNSNMTGNNQVVANPGFLWNHWTENQITKSILKAIAFPLFVILVHFKKLTTGLQLAIVNYIMSAGVFYYFVENGDRLHHGNFFWTYLFGIFFLFLFSIDQMFFKFKHSMWVKILGGLIFLLHLVSGLFYVNHQLIGEGFL